MIEYFSQFPAEWWWNFVVRIACWVAAAIPTSCILLRLLLWPWRLVQKIGEGYEFVTRVYKPAFEEAVRQERLFIESGGQNRRSRSRARGRFASAFCAYRQLNYGWSPATRAAVRDIHSNGKSEHGVQFVLLGGFCGRVVNWSTGSAPDYVLRAVQDWKPSEEVR